MSMVFDISLYSITHHLVSKGSNKLPIFTEFFTQKFILTLWMSLKYFLYTHTSENAHHISNRIFGWYRSTYLYMIVYYFHLFYFTAPRCQYLFKEFLNRISQIFFQYPLAIFRCPHNTVYCAVHCMAQSYTTLLKKGNLFLPVLPHGVSRVSFS